MPFQISIVGMAPVLVTPNSQPISIGRGDENNLSLDDSTLSRQHGRFYSDGDHCFFEDLRSRNGSKLNGHRVTSPCEIFVGDILELGRVEAKVGFVEQVIVDAGASQFFPMDEVRKEFIALESQGGKTLEESLNLLQMIALDLLHDVPIEGQIRKSLERLHIVLKPRRVVALLRSAAGEIKPYLFFPELKDDLPVSRTAVTSICENRQALLVQDRLSDVRVQNATSLVFQSVRSLIAAPLECEGNVEGLLYADAGVGRGPFQKRDLALLATVAHMLAARIRTYRLLEEREHVRSVEREMDLARQIQSNLLPASDPKLIGYEFFGRAIPSRQVGGDLYGYWHPSPERLFGAIADVSGKGVGPGLLMACLVAYMNGSTRLNPQTADLATWLSRDLAGHSSSNRFATAFLFCLDPNQGWLDYTNAGHNPGILIKADEEISRLVSHGLPLALFPGTVPYGQSRIRMNPADLLFLYTDGITEAANASGEEFGMDRLEAILLESRELPLMEIVTRLDQSIDEHCAGNAFGDDRTILILRRTKDT